MSKRDNTDVWTAVVIGAVVGIGATLLVRAQQEDEVHAIMKKLRPVQQGAQRAAKVVRKEVGRRSRAAGKEGRELVSASRDILEDLRDGAREIVDSTRDELKKAALESVREARKAARRTRRTFG
ncbi:MAG TPA: hypothetical protein VK928_01740 [Longimicrobiales bacterium]|nr:hypothetical protein [Longimicrobiales bacterium]